MKILAAIACWNCRDLIAAALQAVESQTLTPNEILIVDNASTDGCLCLNYRKAATIVRNPVNLGISGAVTTALGYGRTHGYDWVWVLDADSRPEPNALALLVSLLQNTPTKDPHKAIGIVGPSHDLDNLGWILRGRNLTPGGPRPTRIRRNQNFIECDTVIWSGALINLAVVDKVGLPRAGIQGAWEDLSLDYGDFEYTYRIHRAGYRILVHRDSIIDHRVGHPISTRFLGWTLYSTNHAPFRRYLYFRNLVFFWLRLYPRRNWPMLLVWFSYRLTMILAGIVLLETGRTIKFRACFSGIRDGLLGRMTGRFGAAP